MSSSSAPSAASPATVRVALPESMSERGMDACKAFALRECYHGEGTHVRVLILEGEHAGEGWWFRKKHLCYLAEIDVSDSFSSDEMPPIGP